MMLGAQVDIDRLKNSFKEAVSRADVNLVGSIYDTMKQQNLGFSVMEQIALLGPLVNVDADIGRTILNCGAFSQPLIMVGLTCLKDFSAQESPYTVPVVEQALAEAAKANRTLEVYLILERAKWCIDPKVKQFALDTINQKPQVTPEEMEGIIYVSKTYLPLSQAAPSPQQENAKNKSPDNRQRKLTM